jgi:hypothetical protein
MLRQRSARPALACFSLFGVVILIGLVLLRSDATLSSVPAEALKPGWRLAIGPGGCGSPCIDDEPFLSVIREELGNFAGELTSTAANETHPGQNGSDTFVLIDPSGKAIASFSRDVIPKRAASRIRVLLTGRFDPEIAETCTPQDLAAVGSTEGSFQEFRDRWQKGL